MISQKLQALLWKGGKYSMIAKNVLKWIPVAVAAIAAGAQAIAEQKNEEKMEEMEERLSKLENKEES